MAKKYVLTMDGIEISNCMQCPLRYFNDVTMMWLCPYLNLGLCSDELMKARPVWCPLVEVVE